MPMKKLMTYPIFPEDLLKDIKLIKEYGGFIDSDWYNGMSLKVSTFISMKKEDVIKHIQGDWLLWKISDSEYRELTGKEVSKALRQERLNLHQDSESYKKNARKALLMSF